MTQASLNDLFDGQGFGTQPKPLGVVLDHDGQAVRFFDPSDAVGIKYGAFDDDFFEDGLLNTMARGSSGQTTMRRADKLLAQVMDGVVPEVVWKVPRPKDPPAWNDLWMARVAIAEDILRGSGEKGPPTVLLDEPDRSLDLPRQAAIWRFLRAASKTTQVIVAAHSLLALQLPEANYVQLDDSMLKAVKVLQGLQTTWQAETPALRARKEKKADG